ncbi:hypothetical protein [Crassaminicella profunda]|uniref:hypothetical protein n=1 Tax=Crassaminicella profunda TaxID=1286698 RepID=UPI001CA694EC|nr:hypothetical protein [Crassaminicella profunda]QZY56498.1 hypothetical protein K7H06_06120 [Crassaminicella profunda]
MCTYNKVDFKIWVEDTLQSALREKEFQKALEKLCGSIIIYYPDIKIWFAEKFGKRWSYIIGAGKESFTQSEKVLLTSNYGVFLQNTDKISCEEKDCIIALMKIICTIKS